MYWKRESVYEYIGSNMYWLTKGWNAEDICFNLHGTTFSWWSILPSQMFSVELSFSVLSTQEMWQERWGTWYRIEQTGCTPFSSPCAIRWTYDASNLEFFPEIYKWWYFHSYLWDCKPGVAGNHLYTVRIFLKKAITEKSIAKKEF